MAKARLGTAVLAVTLVLASASTVPAGAAAHQEAPRPRPAVRVFPAPGTPTISPESQLSFRGAGTGPVPGLRVVGSASGPHPGKWVAHGDGDGVSFVPSSSFRPGEAVAVTTDADVFGTDDGRFQYRVAQPAPPAAPGDTVNAGAESETTADATAVPTSRIRGGAGTATPAGPNFYRSRPDLLPPKINTTPAAGRAPGLLFATGNVRAYTQTGALIYDDQGEPVWFKPVPFAAYPSNLVPITYRGQPALAYFHGFLIPPFLGAFAGEFVVLDTAYRDIGRINTGNGYPVDMHELEISPAGDKALMIIYNPVQLDLTAYGGQPDATYIEGVVQEVDLATGAVTFEWHSLGPGNVAPDDSIAQFPITVDAVDGVHLNSADYDSDGNILISGRHISQVLKINKATGAVMWRFGGERNDFTFTDGDPGPSIQHDARRRPDGTLGIYDNGTFHANPEARGVAYRLDEAAKTARVEVQWRHQPPLTYTPIVGVSRQLPNGNQLVSYGNSGNVTEFRGNGVAFESQLAAGVWTYRTHRSPWRATPAEPPAVALERGAGGVSVFASWNGATEVARWELLGGPDGSRLRVMGSAPRSGFETKVTAFVAPTDRVFRARALNAAGNPIGQSALVVDPIETKYRSLGGGSSVLGARVGGEYAVGPFGVGLAQDYQFGTIYWSPSTGAHETHGAIGFRYRQLGGPGSFLGFPLTDELITPGFTGRFNLFQGGSIYWSPASGAHETHGAIRDKWGSLGYERGFLGFPTTDETATPDGVGRFNHFQGGSIYWTPSTGAWEVHGAIRDRWASLGYERGRLGYPVSDEFTLSAGVRQSNFGGGFIRWYAAFGATQVFYY